MIHQAGCDRRPDRWLHQFQVLRLCQSWLHGIRLLAKRGADRWLISCLHQVRCFGNWMGHPQREGQQRHIQLVDVLAVLSALQRVLEDYPWLLDASV